MRGIILAGGLGTRLLPLTKITNKHLLPIYNKPMIYYPIAKLVEAGIKDILIVTGGNHAGEFVRLLGNGSKFGCKLHYEYQETEGGIAQALGLAENFVCGEKIVVILGDNIFEDSIKDDVKQFNKKVYGAKIFIKRVTNPERFGVVEFNGLEVRRITEKPRYPKTNYIVTGIYMYNNKVFNIIKNLKPSKRKELEITDVNNQYLKQNKLSYRILLGKWTDAGTFESLFKANEIIRGIK